MAEESNPIPLDNRKGECILAVGWRICVTVRGVFGPLLECLLDTLLAPQAQGGLD